MRTVVDASALAAIAFKEDGGDLLATRLAGATIHAPSLLKYELTQVALGKAQRSPKDAVEILGRLDTVLNRRSGIRWHEVNPVDVALVAKANGLSAYDASYLWLAGWLEADLITLDKKLAAAAGFDTEETV